jgi:hypothetical protein
VDAKDIKCLLEWWKKHETIFPIIGFLVKHILEIVKFQIEPMNLFPLTKNLTDLKKCHLQSKNLKNLILMNKNWPNDAKVGCKAFNNLVDFIDSELNLELKLDEFECSFQQDELKEA